MKLHTAYSFGKSIDAPFIEVERNVRGELAKEGFGILSEINVQGKSRKSLVKTFVNTSF